MGNAGKEWKTSHAIDALSIPPSCLHRVLDLSHGKSDAHKLSEKSSDSLAIPSSF